MTGIEGQREALGKLSTDVHQSMSKWIASDGCHTVCTTSVPIGPDGEPVATESCSLVCDM